MNLYALYRRYTALQLRHAWAAENYTLERNFQKRVDHARKSATYGARAFRTWEAIQRREARQ